MKTLLVISLAALFIGAGAGKEEAPIEYITPPGTTHLHGNVYIDVAAVRNVDVREFIYHTKRMGWNLQDTAWEMENWRELYEMNVSGRSSVYPHATLADHRKYLPDTGLYKELPSMKNGYNYMSYYFRHPYFQEHPVTALTYQQAMAYCTWRSNRVTSSFFMLEDSDDIGYRVRYRLPTAEEYRMAIGKLEFIRECEESEERLSDNPVFKPVYSGCAPFRWFWEERNFFFMRDYSVAEMLATEGKAIGLSVKDTLQTDPLYIQDYEGAQYWLGFRCVAVIEKVE